MVNYEVFLGNADPALKQFKTARLRNLKEHAQEPLQEHAQLSDQGSGQKHPPATRS